MRCIFGCASGRATNNALHFWLRDRTRVGVRATQRIIEHFSSPRQVLVSICQRSISFPNSGAGGGRPPTGGLVWRIPLPVAKMLRI
jgi:hypothetical protein